MNREKAHIASRHVQSTWENVSLFIKVLSVGIAYLNIKKLYLLKLYHTCHTLLPYEAFASLYIVPLCIWRP